MNYSQEEINKFNIQASQWWDFGGPFLSLHKINPLRLAFILKNTSLADKKVLDVGCGGGILTEQLAIEGADTTGIDLAPSSIEVATKHAASQNISINYECIDIADKAEISKESFDVITCMEMLEHVPSPQEIIRHISSMLKPDGVAFFSTLNRTHASYLLGIVAAEYILRLLPKGTHDHNKFIKPSEISAMLEQCNLEIVDIIGIRYNPVNKSFNTTKSVDVNYMIACRKIF